MNPSSLLKGASVVFPAPGVHMGRWPFSPHVSQLSPSCIQQLLPRCPDAESTQGMGRMGRGGRGLSEVWCPVLMEAGSVRTGWVGKAEAVAWKSSGEGGMQWLWCGLPFSGLSSLPRPPRSLPPVAPPMTRAPSFCGRAEAHSRGCLPPKLPPLIKI